MSCVNLTAYIIGQSLFHILRELKAAFHWSTHTFQMRCFRFCMHRSFVAETNRLLQIQTHYFEKEL